MTGRVFAYVDRDDIEQAMEIAAGDSLSSEVGAPRTVSERVVGRFRGHLRRFLRELPADATVTDIQAAMDWIE